MHQMHSTKGFRKFTKIYTIAANTETQSELIDWEWFIEHTFACTATTTKKVLTIEEINKKKKNAKTNWVSVE